jgi:hypothetical protein
VPATPKNQTSDELVLTSELDPSQQRAHNRRVRAGEFQRVHPGIYSSAPPAEWSRLIARERNRVLAGLFPGAVFGYRSAFAGGVPVDGVVHLSYLYDRKVELPGLTVILVKAAGKAPKDVPISGRDLHFPSSARLLLENLTISRGSTPKAVGRGAVEERLMTLFESRGEDALTQLRDEARELSGTLGLEREFGVLDGLIGSILGTSSTHALTSAKGKGWAARPLPYDAERLALFEELAAYLRTRTFADRPAVATSPQALEHFAFLESYFSNFIEGTEFEVSEARAFVLDSKPIDVRPKDSHDILGVFRQALQPAWALQTLASGEAVLEQLRARHADQMRERPEVDPGQFKDRVNIAGNTTFVPPRHVRGSLARGSEMLVSVAPGIARALLAMFLVAEVHPFNDGNGRLARLVMNAELSVARQCRIIVPTLFREEYLDCLRVLTRDGHPAPFVEAMEKVHAWTAAFRYEDLDEVIAAMRACNAFEKSRNQFKLLFPGFAQDGQAP